MSPTLPEGFAGSPKLEDNFVQVKQQPEDGAPKQDVAPVQDNANVSPSAAAGRDNSPQQSADTKTTTQPSAATTQDAPMEEEVLAVGPFNFSKTRLEAMAQSVLADEEEGVTTGSDRSKAARKALLNAGKQSTSHYKGVNRHSRSNRWEAHIWDGRQLHLGCFDNELQAAAAYDIVALKIRGPKAGLNFPVRHYQDEIQQLEMMPLEQLVTMVRASRRNQIITNRLRARRRSSGCYYSTADSAVPLFPPEAANDPRPRPLRLSKPFGGAGPTNDPAAGPQPRPALPSGSGASPVKKRRPSADVYEGYSHLSSSPHASAHHYLGTPSPCVTPTASSANLMAAGHPSHGLPPRRAGSFRRHSVASYAPSPDPSALPIYNFYQSTRPFEPMLPPMPSNAPLQLPIEHLSLRTADDMRTTPDPAAAAAAAVMDELDALPSLIGGPSLILGPGGAQQLQAAAVGDPLLQDLMNAWRQPPQQQQQQAAQQSAQQQQQQAAAAAFDGYAAGAGFAGRGLGGGGLAPQALRAQLQRQGSGAGAPLHHAAAAALGGAGGVVRATVPSAAPGSGGGSGGLQALPSWPPLARTAAEAMQWEALNLATADAISFRTHHTEQPLLDTYHAPPQRAGSGSGASAPLPPASAAAAAPSNSSSSASASASGGNGSVTASASRRRSPFFNPPAPEADAPAAGSHSHLLGGPAGQDLHTMAPPPASSSPFENGFRHAMAELTSPQLPPTSAGAPAGGAAAGGWASSDPLADENVEALEVMMMAAAQAVDRQQQRQQAAQQQWRAQVQQHLGSSGELDQGLAGAGAWLGGGGGGHVAGPVMVQVHQQQRAFQPPLSWQDL